MTGLRNNLAVWAQSSSLPFSPLSLPFLLDSLNPSSHGQRPLAPAWAAVAAKHLHTLVHTTQTLYFSLILVSHHAQKIKILSWPSYCTFLRRMRSRRPSTGPRLGHASPH